MDREAQLEDLYRDIAEMLVDARVFPRLPSLLGLPDPVVYIVNWARNNPNEAYRLAVDIRDKLVQKLHYLETL